MKFFISDLDKTLLNSKHAISKGNELALNKLEDLGYQLAIASGRSYQDIKKIMSTINIKVPIISLNGAIVTDQNENIISKTPISNLSFIIELINKCEENNLIYHIYTLNNMYSRKYKNMIQTLYNLSASKHQDIDMIIESMQIYYNAFYKWSIISDEFKKKLFNKEIEIFKFEIMSEKKDILNEIKNNVPSTLTVASSTPRNIEITEKNINKGNAIRQLVSYYSISTSDIVAIGDNINDLEMLKIAGTSIAMGNSEEKIKQICSLISVDCENDGGAYAINNFIK